MDFKKIDEMWDTGKFEITISRNHEIYSMGLLCVYDRDCYNCKLDVLNEHGQCLYKNMSTCSNKIIELYLLKNKPKVLIKEIRACPTDDIRYWITKLQETYPIKDFPEYYI